ncbi:hypothetical protein RA210_U70155 [Rubrivivax sp. A210]|uniref:primase-helicase family protein n=1 Tax=Rubrivivax sp. A210 TaxID=2772301 RepID=UPI001919F1B0|nr:primase-helicase family protein [Rubrivivax sp. A210]CAD5374839.1 hypothetical protein RA210_U70155 [Rubrivivax sp. A210]
MSGADSLTIVTSAGVPLAKRWTAAGTVEAVAHAWQFEPVTYPVNGLHELAGLLKGMEGAHCSALIRGKFIGHEAAALLLPDILAAANERRARQQQEKLTTTRALKPDHVPRVTALFPDQPLHTLMIDIDDFKPVGIDPVADPVAAIQAYIRLVLPAGFHGCSFYWQLSGSAGHPCCAGKLKGHLWFWLETPYTSMDMKAWGKPVPGLDVSIYQPVQLHFTAGPIFDKGVSDPVPVRSGLHQGLRDDVPLALTPEVLAASAARQQGMTAAGEQRKTAAREPGADPGDKGGWHGAFCRVYRPEDLADLEPGEFAESGERDGRFDWIGHAAAGVFITDDGHRLISTHNTAPTGQNMPNNTFDFVRLHNYGHLDEGMGEDVSMTKRHSYTAMVADIKKKHPEVVAEYETWRAAERSAPEDDFGGLEGDGTPGGEAERPAGTSCAAGPMTEQAAVDLINQAHFVAPLAGAMTIWHEGTNPETGMHSVDPIPAPSLALKYAPYTARVPGPKGAIKTAPIVDVWTRSARRREYPGGVIFDPETPTRSGCYNTWRGFSIEPKAGDAGPMIEHIYMLCHGAAEHAEWLLNWLAFTVQRPGTRPEVAVVLRGNRGTGKGSLCNLILTLWGPHGLHITQTKHLTGNFNAHLRATRFLFVDEGYWAGDKAGEGVLKGLVTEPTIAIERKGVDVTTAINRLAIVIAANGEWVVPAGADERRFFVVDVSAARAQDHAYFGALKAWIDGNGAAIFLHHLLQRDLTGFNVRSAPKTAALDRQKIEAMPALDRWILELLDTAAPLPQAGGFGVFPDEDDTDGGWTEEPQRLGCTAASAAFDRYCRQAAVRGVRPDSRAIGKRLQEVFECGPAKPARCGAPSPGRAWTLPGITRAREMAAKTFGLDHYVWAQV